MSDKCQFCLRSRVGSHTVVFTDNNGRSINWLCNSCGWLNPEDSTPEWITATEIEAARRRSPSFEVECNIQIDLSEVEESFQQCRESLERFRHLIRNAYSLEFRRAVASGSFIPPQSWDVPLDNIRYVLPKQPSSELIHSCANCDYFIKGFRPGEPNTCNAFHTIENAYSSNDCPDWE